MRRTLAKPYYGCARWLYRVTLAGVTTTGEVNIRVPTSNRREDEAMARCYLRAKIGVPKLPTGTHVWPASDE